MKKTVLACALTLATTVAYADAVTISTGVRGGVYDTVYGANMARVLKGKNHTVTTINSAGSAENLQRLQRNEAQITIATNDAYADYLKKGGKPLNILTALKTECGYLVVKKDGKVRNEDDLQTVKGAVVAIGDSGSGSEVMWKYMTSLEKGYSNSQIVNQGGTMALNALGTQGGPDALLFVTAKDNLTHKLVQAVNANPQLKFVDIDDNDLNDKLTNGTAVYTFESNRVNNNTFGSSVSTICTTGNVFYNDEASKAVLEDLSDVLAMSKVTITGQ